VNFVVVYLRKIVYNSLIWYIGVRYAERAYAQPFGPDLDNTSVGKNEN